jgi:hypothetical protein
MLSPVLVLVHNKCGYICAGGLFPIREGLQGITPEDDEVANDRSNHFLFVYHCGVSHCFVHIWVLVSLA